MYKYKLACVVSIGMWLGCFSPAHSFENAPVAVSDLQDGSIFSSGDNKPFLHFASNQFRQKLSRCGKSFDVHDRDVESKQLKTNPSVKFKKCDFCILGTITVFQPRKRVPESAPATEDTTTEEQTPSTPGEMTVDVKVVDIATSEIVTVASARAAAEDTNPLEVSVSEKTLNSNDFKKSATVKLLDGVLSKCVQQLEASAKDENSRWSKYVAKMKNRSISQENP